MLGRLKQSWESQNIGPTLVGCKESHILCTSLIRCCEVLSCKRVNSNFVYVTILALASRESVVLNWTPQDLMF